MREIFFVIPCVFSEPKSLSSWPVLREYSFTVDTVTSYLYVRNLYVRLQLYVRFLTISQKKFLSKIALFSLSKVICVLFSANKHFLVDFMSILAVFWQKIV